MTSRSLFSLGLWNTLEHAWVRIADALITLVILRAFTPELFGALAIVQTWVSIALWFFIPPSTVLYWKFRDWQDRGGAEFRQNIILIRRTAWAAGLLAVLVSGVLTVILGGERQHVTLFALIWSFSIALGPQIVGVDREFLRLSLAMKTLNILGWLQKLLLLGAVIAVSVAFPGNMVALGASGAIVLILSVLVHKICVDRRLAVGVTDAASSAAAQAGWSRWVAILRETGHVFALPAHVLGVVQNTVLTLDLFFVGLLLSDVRMAGIYATAVKLTNLLMALPTALSNFYSVLLGRRKKPEDLRSEAPEVLRGSLALGAVTAVCSVIGYVIFPHVLPWLNHGRWTTDETEQFLRWTPWMLAGVTVYAVGAVPVAWLTLRENLGRLVRRVHFPWLAGAAAIYAGAVYVGGFDGVARANIAVFVLQLVLITVFLRSYFRPRPYGVPAGSDPT